MVNIEVINNLWYQIDKLHMIYLQTEDTPLRIEQKRKLEACMKDYLSLVAPNQRFYCHSTKEVLYNSILQKKNRNDQFSLTKFSQAWEMLGTYAANLLIQPWRKEFREIRLYSGAFKHQIEQQLQGAEEILMEMGYMLDVEYNRLVMQGIIDPDKAVYVSRDCLMAKVEAQILSEIHAALAMRLGTCSWTDIFSFRDRYVGSVSHCVRGLLYQHHQKETVFYSMNPPISSGFLGPHEMYPPMNGFPYQMGMMGGMGGMGFGGMPAMATMGMTSPMNYPCNKPSYYPYHLPVDHYSSYLPKTLPSEDDSRNCPTDMLHPKTIEQHVEEPFHMWNVNQLSGSNNYRAYSSGNTLKSVPKFDSHIDLDHLEQLCSDEVDHYRRRGEKAMETGGKKFKDDRYHMVEKNFLVASQPKFASSNPPKSAESSGTFKDEPKSSVPIDHPIMRPVSKNDNGPATSSHSKRTASQEDPKASVPTSVNHRVNTYNGARPKEWPSPSRSVPGSLADIKVEGWECLSCTFVNSEEREICEMCAKSRHKGPETQPLLRGGRECSKCTLVNPPEAIYCSACASSLDDAPTYI